MAKIKKTEETQISWKAEGAYPIRLVDNAFDEADTTLATILRTCGAGEMPRVLLVADYNVVHYTEGIGSRIGRYFQAHGIKLAGPAVILSGGERIKNDKRQSALRVARAAIEARIGCRDVLLAIGGGSVLDVAGFAAAQIRSGIKFVRMPTTLATQAEGAYSDYAALNEGYVKDAYRIPSHPAAVVVDVSFTRTILDGVWFGGIGECLRYAATQDAALVKLISTNIDALMARDEAAAKALISNMIDVRAKKGATDFAKWSAMRLEAMSNYRLPHGYALAIGTCLEGLYAIERGVLKASDWEIVPTLLRKCGALQGLVHSQRLFSQPANILMGLDALSITTGSMARILPKAIGKGVVEETPDREVYESVLSRFVETMLGSEGTEAKQA